MERDCWGGLLVLLEGRDGGYGWFGFTVLWREGYEVIEPTGGDRMSIVHKSLHVRWFVE